MVKKYNFSKTKYGESLLIDLIRLESLEKYMNEECSHCLSYYDITLLTSGKGTFSIDQFTYPIEPGIIFFSSPGQVRNWNIEELPTGYVLIFEEEFLSCFLNDTQFVEGLKYFNAYASPLGLTLFPSDAQYLKQLMQSIEQEISLFTDTDKHILRALLYQTLVWLNRKYTAAYPSSITNEYNRHIRSFVSMVSHEFTQHHSVSYYAGKLNITAGYLNDLCKSYLGVSAKKYLQNRIMVEAKNLLSYSDLSVSEVAFRLNFEDPSYFIRKFKLSAGSTPLSFRNESHL
jgi:AraC family transcriptional regulator, transcriptional activator of pobA